VVNGIYNTINYTGPNPNTPSNDEWTTLKCVLNGSNFTVLCNDVVIWEALSSEATELTEAGGWGLCSRGDVSIVGFDDFTVTSDEIPNNTDVAPREYLVPTQRVIKTSIGNSFPVFSLLGQRIDATAPQTPNNAAIFTITKDGSSGKIANTIFEW
jgi:hypothetical protein